MKMVEGYDGTAIVELLTRYAPPAATILELGTGPGTDFDLIVRAGFDVGFALVDLSRTPWGGERRMAPPPVTRIRGR